MAIVGTFFEQARPKSTWKTLYVAKGGEVMSYLNITNVSGVACDWYFCISRSGQKYSRANALVWQEPINAHDTDVWGYGIPLAPGMRLGVLSSIDSALNFTVYGLFQE